MMFKLNSNKTLFYDGNLLLNTGPLCCRQFDHKFFCFIQEMKWLKSRTKSWHKASLCTLVISSNNFKTDLILLMLSFSFKRKITNCSVKVHKYWKVFLQDLEMGSRVCMLVIEQASTITTIGWLWWKLSSCTHVSFSALSHVARARVWRLETRSSYPGSNRHTVVSMLCWTIRSLQDYLVNRIHKPTPHL